jgi:hypothetical protein
MRLRIRTTLDMRPSLTGAHVYVERAGHDREKLEGVRSVTWHCGGSNEPVVAVLAVEGVELDALCDLPPAATAALRLIAESKKGVL